MNTEIKFLKKGDKVAIVSPAGCVDEKFVLNGKKILESCGFMVEIGNNALNRYNLFAGTDEERISDLNHAITDDNTKAVFCARGGYGTAKILPFLALDHFKLNPKWIIGHSDITALHCSINKMGLKSIHGEMPVKWLPDNTNDVNFRYLIETLQGNFPEYTIEPNINNKQGSATAELVGGNLSVIYSLQATPYELNTDNKILFIEDIAEFDYHIDRMLTNFHLAGKLRNLKGLICGGFTSIKPGAIPYGKSIEEMILEKVKEYDFPVIFDFPAGHQPKNFPLKIGQKVKIEVEKRKCKISFPSNKT